MLIEIDTGLRLYQIAAFRDNVVILGHEPEKLPPGVAADYCKATAGPEL